MLHTKKEKKRPIGTPRIRWIDQIRKNIGMRGGKYKKTGSGRIEMTGDFFIIVNPYLWKLPKNDYDKLNCVII